MPRASIPRIRRAYLMRIRRQRRKRAELLTTMYYVSNESVARPDVPSLRRKRARQRRDPRRGSGLWRRGHAGPVRHRHQRRYERGRLRRSAGRSGGLLAARSSPRRSGCASGPTRSRSAFTDDGTYDYADLDAAGEPSSRCRMTFPAFCRLQNDPGPQYTLHEHSAHMFPDRRPRRGHSGAALVVGLLLLLVLTILAISGWPPHRSRLLMAGNEQYQERAFQAADSAGRTRDHHRALQHQHHRRRLHAIGLISSPAADADSRHWRDRLRADDPGRRRRGQRLDRLLRILRPVRRIVGHHAGPRWRLQPGHRFQRLSLRRRQLRHIEPRGESDHQASFYVIGPGGTCSRFVYRRFACTDNFCWPTSTIASVTLSPVPAVAQVAVSVSEAAIESSTEIVNLPSSVPTTLDFTPCSTCRLVRLRLDESSRFFVGRQQVTLGDLRRYAQRGPTGLDIFFSENTRVVTRIILRTNSMPPMPDGPKTPSDRQPKP